MQSKNQSIDLIFLIIGLGSSISIMSAGSMLSIVLLDKVF